MCAGQEKEILHLPDRSRLIERALRRIQGGFDVQRQVDPDLFAQAAAALNQAVDKAVAMSVKWGQPDRAFISELRHNNALFAAFKAHREQNDLARLLVDPDGRPRGFDSFRKAAEPIVREYNVNWLQTEYAAAVRAARTAVRFKRYEQDGDLFPNAEWLPSRAAEPRAAHRKYYHTVRSLSDPWWETHFPGCVWGCQCDMRNTDKPITHVGDTPAVPGAQPTDVPPSEEAGLRSPGLSRNPARSKSLFSADHPYFTTAYPGAAEAVATFLHDNERYQAIPTERGQVRLHDGHGKGERQENIRVASYFANKYGYEIDLLDNPDGVKSADSYNRSLDRFEEYKVNTTPSKNSIDRLIRDARKQADHIVLWIDSDISLGDLRSAIYSRVKRSDNIKSVRIVIHGKDRVYTREQITKDDFIIKQADLK